MNDSSPIVNAFEKIKLGTCALIVILAGCSTATTRVPNSKAQEARAAKTSAPKAAAHEATSGRESAGWLTEEEANARLMRLKNIHYTLAIGLGAQSEEFKGRVTVQFDLTQSTVPLTLDFEQGTIESITDVTTGKAVPYTFKEHFIVFGNSALKEGTNEIRIVYHRPYSKSGTGFYRFQDPEDHQVYIYTDFEPYRANGFFPCFDQPSLKATYQITVIAPKEWMIVSSTRESKVTPNGTLQTWTFPKSKSFSTYLVSLIAGPFHVWTDRAGDIPIRLMVRKSLAKYVLHDEWISITKQGLEFYQKYFDYKYPFAKYDQIILPDFNEGAMENVAAVTFSERYIKRGEPTEIEKEDLSVTVLHEMAHMWFGDLVTMKWWNGLWLNESFATFMSYLATDQATRFKASWESFHLGEKQWGYLEDQYVTTHPIETSVESTDVADSNFDGITYAKGASVLKQLNFYLTPEKFQMGVRAYFKKYAFQNTTTDNFFGSLGEASGQKLDEWTESWVKTAGLNSVRPDFTCKDGKLEHLILHQSGPSGLPTARAHRLSVGLIQAKPFSIQAINFLLNAEDVEVIEARGAACPDLIFPNLEDEAYIKVDLDPTSRKNVTAVLDSGKASLTPLLKSLIWTTYFTSVRDGKTPAEEYLTEANRALQVEADERISSFLLSSMVQERVISYVRSALFYVHDDASREYWRGQLESSFRELLKRTNLSLDLRRSIFDSYIRIIVTKNGLNELANALGSKDPIFGFELDQDRRWNTLAQLMRNQVAEAPQLIEQEKKKDSSHAGALAALSAQVVAPNLDVKSNWLEKFQHDPNISVADIRAVSQWMFPDEQGGIRRTLFAKMRTTLNALAKDHDSSFSRSLRGIIPIDGRTDTNEFLQAWWNQDHNWLPTVIERTLRVAIQENELTRKNRAVSRPVSAKNPMPLLVPAPDPSAGQP